MSEFARDVQSGKRFQFGENWLRFSTVVDEERIEEAEISLRKMLGTDSLQGKTFLDIGSGSGLFSLAARRLGARVVSFDYDTNSVRCTAEMRSKFFPGDGGDDAWSVTEGSALDLEFVKSLGEFDIVYAWGVLHHTGNMWRALDIVQNAVKEDGRLFIMIYLDRGWKSTVWRAVKRTYCSSISGRFAVVGTFIPYYIIRGVAEDVLRLRNPLLRYREYKKKRGMSKLHDWIDWLGGYPYECAKPKEIIDFYSEHGFQLITHLGNEYVFRRSRGVGSEDCERAA